MVFVSITNHGVAGNEENLELDKAVLGSLGLPLHRFALKVFTFILLNEAELLHHALHFTCLDIVHVQKVFDVVCVLLELQGQLLIGIKDK